MFIECKDDTPQPLHPGVIIKGNEDSDSSDNSSDEGNHPSNTRPESTGEPDMIIDEQIPTGDCEMELQPPRCSTRKLVPSAAGVVMKDIQIELNTEKAVREAKEASLRTHTAKAA